MVQGFTLISRSYYYLRRRSPGPTFPPDRRQAGERGATIPADNGRNRGVHLAGGRITKTAAIVPTLQLPLSGVRMLRMLPCNLAAGGFQHGALRARREGGLGRQGKRVYPHVAGCVIMMGGEAAASVADDHIAGHVSPHCRVEHCRRRSRVVLARAHDMQRIVGAHLGKR
jgi:hypothetical protein